MGEKSKTNPRPRMPLKVNDYALLPLTIPPTPSFPYATQHNLYIRHHAPKFQDNDTPRSLFVVNVPISATERSIRKLFSEQLGGSRVERVEFEGLRSGQKTTGGLIESITGEDHKPQDVAPKQGGKRSRKRKRGEDGELEQAEKLLELPRTWNREILRSGSAAIVVFADRTSAEVAMREIVRLAKARQNGRKEVVWEVEPAEEKLGEERYRTHHTLIHPTPHTLQEIVSRYMTLYTAAETARTKARARQRSVPDADGFITVTRGGRAGPARLEEAQAAAERQQERQKGKEDFYRFQLREKAKERESEVRRKFEAEKKKILELRERRGKVKPM